MAPLGAEVWENTLIELPRQCMATTLHVVFDGAEVRPVEREGRHFVRASEALAHFPVALLSSSASTINNEVIP